MDMPDSQLASLAGDGNAEAWRLLFERYQQPIYNFVYRMVDNAEDAADIVQNAFIKVFTALGGTEISNFSAYLYRTARNLSYDEIRRRQRFADVDQGLLAPEDPNIYADPQRALMLGEQLQKVRQALGGLNENHRAALIMRELQEMDYDEMAEILESNRNAVGALLSRARLRFREELRMAQVDAQKLPPECEEVIALLSPYIDGELDSGKVDEVEYHVNSCTFCAAALEEMQEASRSFRMLIPVLPPEGIAQAVTGGMKNVADGNSGSSVSRLAARKIVWTAAAGAIAIIGAAVFVAGGLGGGNAESGTSSPEPQLKSVAGPLAAAHTTSTPARVETTITRTAPEAPVETAAAQETETPPAADSLSPGNGAAAGPPANTTPTQTTTGASNGTEPPSNVQIQNGYFYPSPANEILPVTFDVFASGHISKVSIKLTYASTGAMASTFDLASSGSRETGGMWSDTQTINSGRYNVFTVVLGNDGVESSQSIGVLDVFPYHRSGTATPPL